MKSFKNVILLLGILFLGAANAFANEIENINGFIPRMEYFVGRELATVRVWNDTFRPIVCSGTAFGQTRSGMVVNAWMANMVIYPGMFVNLYVYSNFYDPFVRAHAQVRCF